MPYKLHKNAKLTPAQRRYIQENPDGLSVTDLARKFGVSRHTIYKWLKREDVEDRSCAPIKVHRALDEVQQAVVALLRERLNLSGDDILRIVRKCLGWEVSRSTLYRYLQQMGLTAKGSASRKWKEFEQVKEPGFIHIDVYYLPRIGGKRAYLYVAIDRATRCTWVMFSDKKDSYASVKFLKQCVEAFPFKIHTVLTDNGKEFTDAYSRGRRRPSGLHPFDATCRQLGIKHKLTKPYRPQTNGLVERLIGKIDSYVVKQYKAQSINDLFDKIVQFLVCYHYTYHSSLQTSPIERLSQLLKNKDPADQFIEKLKKLYNCNDCNYNENKLLRHDILFYPQESLT